MNTSASAPDCTFDAHDVDPSDLQGNILVGHARDHVALVLFRFSSNETAARALVRWLGGVVTRAWTQDATHVAWKTMQGIEPTFFSCFLTSTGYDRLGVVNQGDGRPGDQHFGAGMRAEERALSPPRGLDHWERLYCDETIDAAILVADWNEQRCSAGVDICMNQNDWAAAVEWAHIERGRTYRNRLGQPVEHFGFVDGVSQPLLKSAPGGTPNGSKLAQVDPHKAVLTALHCVHYGVRTESGIVPRRGIGSYMVFRKLEQDVDRFAAYVASVANTVNPASPDIDYAGACLVGRFKDGTPLTLSDQPSGQPKAHNNFDYNGDHGTRCPYHAHIRKANRRVGGGLPQIVRRGITYGTRATRSDGTLDESQSPSEPVGLLFIAYMRRIEQFYHMQNEWLNSDFPSHDSSTVDPISGHPHPRLQPVPPVRIPKDWDQSYTTPNHPIPFASHVCPRGGAYFFAPPINFLKSLV